jgi:hypothetical protein
MGSAVGGYFIYAQVATRVAQGDAVMLAGKESNLHVVSTSAPCNGSKIIMQIPKE